MRQRVAAVRQTGEERSDLAALEEIDQPRDHPLGFVIGAGGQQAGDRVHDDDGGLKRGDLLEHGGQVHFQAAERGSSRVKLQQIALDQRLQPQPDGAHVADDLVGRFLEREEEDSLLAPGGGLGETGSHTGLAGAGCAREQNAAAAMKAPAAQHRVEPRDAGGNPLVGHFVVQPQRCDGQHADAFLADEEGKFVGAVQRAPIFHHPQVACGDLVMDAMIEQDDAVGHVFLEPVARQLFAPALGRDDGGDAFVLQPAEKPAQLGAQDAFIGQAGEQRFERVQHHAFGADGFDRVIEANEQAFQVILAGLLDFTALDLDAIEYNLLAPDQARQVKAERRNVRFQLRLRLLERHQDPRLAELCRAAHEEFRGQQRLTATRTAADQRGPPARQPATGDFVEPLDARRTLGQSGGRVGG